ncbi:MAG: GntR family transcriptional regulator [Bacillus sp. (in: Bacteria)]|nr:GntR family transcriptional regulator [Bacillus sp. (in: firmicutes)]
MEVIRKQNICELVANDIKNRIKTGELKPGDKLETVEQLAKNYGVGRPSIREALSTLKGMGLVEMRHGEGTFVQEYDYSHFTFSQNSLLLLNHKELMDLFEVRKSSNQALFH